MLDGRFLEEYPYAGGKPDRYLIGINRYRQILSNDMEVPGSRRQFGTGLRRRQGGVVFVPRQFTSDLDHSLMGASFSICE
jgi:hypothetical protein